MIFLQDKYPGKRGQLREILYYPISLSLNCLWHDDHISIDPFPAGRAVEDTQIQREQARRKCDWSEWQREGRCSSRVGVHFVRIKRLHAGSAQPTSLRLSCPNVYVLTCLGQMMKESAITKVILLTWIDWYDGVHNCSLSHRCVAMSIAAEVAHARDAQTEEKKEVDFLILLTVVTVVA